MMRIILVLLIALPLVYFWDKDTIPVNEGFGWDGNMYGMYTQHWDEAMKQKAVNEFRMHRILIPFLWGKYYALKGITPSKEEVIQAYRLSNAFFIGIGILFYFLLAKAAQWRWDVTSLGFAGLFISVPILKMSLFYPLMPDIPTFAFGIIALYLWYKNWPIPLLLTILVGWLTSPTMILFGLLLISPRNKIKPQTSAKPWFSLLPPLMFLILWTITWLTNPKLFNNPPSNSHPVQMNLLLPSIILVLTYLFSLGGIIRSAFENLFAILKGIKILRLLLFILGGIGLKIAIQHWAGEEAAPQTIASYLNLLLMQPVTWPGGFVVSHFVYLPGLILILILSRNHLIPTIHSEGGGLLFLSIIISILLLGTESRQIIQLFPLIAFIGLQALQMRSELPKWFIFIVFLFLGYMSQFWQIIGADGSMDGNYLSEPAQHYFKFHRPWMNGESWAINAGILVTCSILIIIADKKSWFLHNQAENMNLKND